MEAPPAYTVDICATCLTDKPPKLPLREELMSLGFEVVLNADGVGEKATRHESRKALDKYRKEWNEKSLKKKQWLKSKKRIKAEIAERKRVEQELKLLHALSYENYGYELMNGKKPSDSSLSTSSSSTTHSSPRRNQVIVTTTTKGRKKRRWRIFKRKARRELSPLYSVASSDIQNAWQQAAFPDFLPAPDVATKPGFVGQADDLDLSTLSSRPERLGATTAIRFEQSSVTDRYLPDLRTVKSLIHQAEPTNGGQSQKFPDLLRSGSDEKLMLAATQTVHNSPTSDFPDLLSPVLSPAPAKASTAPENGNGQSCENGLLVPFPNRDYCEDDRKSDEETEKKLAEIEKVFTRHKAKAIPVSSTDLLVPFPIEHKKGPAQLSKTDQSFNKTAKDEPTDLEKRKGLSQVYAAFDELDALHFQPFVSSNVEREETTGAYWSRAQNKPILSEPATPDPCSAMPDTEKQQGLRQVFAAFAALEAHHHVYTGQKGNTSSWRASRRERLSKRVVDRKSSDPVNGNSTDASLAARNSAAVNVDERIQKAPSEKEKASKAYLRTELQTLLSRDDTRAEEVAVVLDRGATLFLLDKDENGRVPLHRVCARKMNDCFNREETSVTAGLVAYIQTFKEIIKTIQQSEQQACQLLDNNGDLPVHLAARNLMVWEATWYERVYNLAATDKSGSAGNAITVLYRNMSECVEILLRPVAEHSQLCQESGSVGFILPAHIASIFTSSVATLRRILESYPQAAKLTCNLGDLDIFIPDRCLPIELHDQLSTDFPKWESEVQSSDFSWSKAGNAGPHDIDDSIRRSDLLYSYNPLVEPFRFDQARVRRCEAYIVHELQSLAEKKQDSVSKAAELLLVFFCTFRESNSGVEVYFNTVESLLRRISDNAAQYLSEIKTRDGKTVRQAAGVRVNELLAKRTVMRTMPRPAPTKSVGTGTNVIANDQSRFAAADTILPASAEASILSGDCVATTSAKQIQDQTLSPLLLFQTSKVCLGSLCRKIFNIRERSHPTNFVILPYRLMRSGGRDLGAESMAETQAAIEFTKCVGDLVTPQFIWQTLENKAKSFDGSTCPAETARDPAAGKSEIARAVNRLLGLYKPEMAYLYLLDDVSGMLEVAESSDEYPIAISEPRGLVRKLLPLMLPGLILLQKPEAFRTLAQVLTEIEPRYRLPEWRQASKAVQVALESGSAFDVHDSAREKDFILRLSDLTTAMENNSLASTNLSLNGQVWKSELTILKMLLDLNDPHQDYAGLRRIIDTNEGWLWSKLISKEDSEHHVIKQGHENEQTASCRNAIEKWGDGSEDKGCRVKHTNYKATATMDHSLVGFAADRAPCFSPERALEEISDHACEINSKDSLDVVASPRGVADFETSFRRHEAFGYPSQVNVSVAYLDSPVSEQSVSSEVLGFPQPALMTDLSDNASISRGQHSSLTSSLQDALSICSSGNSFNTEERMELAAMRHTILYGKLDTVPECSWDNESGSNGGTRWSYCTGERVWNDMTGQLNQTQLRVDQNIFQLKVDLAHEASFLAALTKRVSQIKKQESRLNAGRLSVPTISPQHFLDAKQDGNAALRRLIMRLCEFEEKLLIDEIQMQHLTLEAHWVKEELNRIEIDEAGTYPFLGEVIYPLVHEDVSSLLDESSDFITTDDSTPILKAIWSEASSADEVHLPHSSRRARAREKLDKKWNKVMTRRHINAQEHGRKPNNAYFEYLQSELVYQRTPFDSDSSMVASSRTTSSSGEYSNEYVRYHRSTGRISF